MKRKFNVQCEKGTINKSCARDIARLILKFYSHEENVKAFEEWREKRNAGN